MNTQMRFYSTLMKKMAKLFEEDGSIDREKLDRKAYRIAKSLVAEYEHDNPKSIDVPYEKDGMYFNLLDSDRHFTKLKVKFLALECKYTDSGLPMSKFSFEIVDGPHKGNHIHHMSIHTKGFSRKYITEDNFVKKGLRYDKAYSSKEAEEIPDYVEILNQNLPGKFVYEVYYYPAEGKHMDTKVRIISATPSEETGALLQ